MHGLMMDYPLTIDRLFEYAAGAFPDKEIVTMTPDGSLHRYSYQEFAGRTRRLANALLRLGSEPGDRVATFAWNHYQHLELYYAIPGVAAVCHTLNLRLSPEQLVYIINHAEDKTIFADASVIAALEAIHHQLPAVQHYVIINAGDDFTTQLENVLFYEDLIDQEEELADWLVKDENTAAGMCYTSGTTGNPKGVLYSHRSTCLHAMQSNQANALAFTEADVVLTVVPQFHVMAWGFPYSAIMAGARLVMPGPHLDSESLADLLAGERVTVANGVPTIWSGVYQELKRKPRNISHIRSLVIGGSALPPYLMEAFENEFGVDALHAWGMTEMSPLGTLSKLRTHHLALDQSVQRALRSKQGTAMFGVELRVIDENAIAVPRDGQTAGEIQVRGPCVLKCYYKTEVNAEQFTEDGWFRTGDVATLDADGYVQITDRTKDLIKSGGEWISSVALESSLMSHGSVKEAAVIAIPDSKWEERPLAAVVMEENSPPLTLQEVREFLSPHFAKFWLPDKLALIDEVPKTSVGKFDKKVLRQRYADGRLTDLT